MNIMQKKLADLMTTTAERALKELDKNSPCAKAIKKMDIEKALREDIEKICITVSLGELTKLLSLAAKIKTSGEDTQKKAKTELKAIGETVALRAEEKHGPLNLPTPCRSLLLEI